MGLFFNTKIVEWEPGYYPDINTASYAQKKSYEEIKKSIRSGKYIECSDAYLYAYSYELNRAIITFDSLDISRWQRLYEEYRLFISIYKESKPKVVSYLYPWMLMALILTKADIRASLEDYMEFYIRNNLSGGSDLIVSLYVSAHRITSSSEKIDGRLFRAFVGEDVRKFMTGIGKKYSEEVMQVVDVMLQGDYDNSGINYLYRLYDFEDGVINPTDMVYITVGPKRSTPVSEHGIKMQIQYPTYNPVKKTAYIKRLIHEAENLVRENKGLQRIGEGWVSETLLYRQVESAFDSLDVNQHSSPAFLGSQHYDVYIPKYKIALEYQGAQHTRPVEYFGGEEAYRKGLERDARKKRISTDNGVYLIEVFPGYELADVIRDIFDHLPGELDKSEGAISLAIERASKASVKLNDLSVSQAKAIKRLDTASDDAEMEDYKYELLMKKMLNATKKTNVEDRSGFMDIPHDEFEKMIEQLNIVKEVSKTDPVESNRLGFELMESGYRAPAIYERIAINYHKLGELEKEVQILLDAKKNFGYNFDERIKKIIKAQHKSK